MNFAIVIEGDPQRDRSLAHAYEFARAAVAAGHRIHRAFLYHDAVRIAGSDFDDNILVDSWIQLARKHSFELAACVSAAERRGIATVDDMVRDGIAIVGLGQFADCLLQADRTVVFRA